MRPARLLKPILPTFFLMATSSNRTLANVLFGIIYWSLVGIPLAWGIWKTAAKLPALFH
jgi:hypothetical protein